MRKGKRLEVIASILVLGAFALVAVLLNVGRVDRTYWSDLLETYGPKLAGRHAPVPLYAKNIWRGKAYTQEIDFGPDGQLQASGLVAQMYEKMFPGHLHDGERTKANVHVVARHADGTVFLDTWVHNLRTNAGINWQYNQMAGSTAAVCTYIALTNAAVTPGATDTTLSSEITNNGLARALATATHVSNATSYTLVNTFTATATQAAQAAGMFNNSGGGTLCFENTFTQASLVANDTLTVTWTITF